jgi:hypothetical protein
MKNEQLYQHTTLANIIYLYQLLHATLGKHNLSVPSLFLTHNFFFLTCAAFSAASGPCNDSPNIIAQFAALFHQDGLNCTFDI